VRALEITICALGAHPASCPAAYAALDAFTFQAPTLIGCFVVKERSVFAALAALTRWWPCRCCRAAEPEKRDYEAVYFVCQAGDLLTWFVYRITPPGNTASGNQAALSGVTPSGAGLMTPEPFGRMLSHTACRFRTILLYFAA